MDNREAIDKIKWRKKTASHIAGEGEDGKAFEDLDIAIQAIEELEQLHKIGTTKEIIALVTDRKSRREWFQLGYADCEKKYAELGTIEQVREAVERMKPKKPITYKGTNRADCPCCGATVRAIKEPYGDWCSKCGQKLDWSVEE